MAATGPTIEPIRDHSSSNPTKSHATVSYVDPNTDPSLLTTDMKAKLYKQHESPRKTAELLVRDYAYINGAGDSARPVINKNLDEGRRQAETVLGEFGQQTLASTLKTRSLFKNYDHKHIDQIDGNSFADRLLRPGEPIRQTVNHDTELVRGNQERYDNFLHSWKKSANIRFNNDLSTLEDEVRQRNAVSKIDGKMPGILEDGFKEEDVYKTMRFRSVMFKNDQQQKTRKKDSIYDYHRKIQATIHLSKNLDRRHSVNWRTSVPPGTFDKTRGASPEMNSYNNLHQYMPHSKEFPRLSVLQNFKEINRIMTNNFRKNKQLEEKYKQRLPADFAQKMEMEQLATANMINIMKKMHSPRNFISPLQKVGSVQNYQNCNLARSIMLESDYKRSKGALTINASEKSKQLVNYNSLMHNSSQFDRANMSSTIDNSMNNNQFSISTEIDPMEQKHNAMNLALGKPTQSFRQTNLKKLIKGNAQNSIQGTTADSFAMQQSSTRADQSKWRQHSVLQDESLLSSISQPLEKNRDKSQKQEQGQLNEKSVISNRPQNESNMTAPATNAQISGENVPTTTNNQTNNDSLMM